MILLIVWDGLRPDMLSPENTPFVWEVAHRGVVCQAGHSVFPTSTRVNSASLATGCYPGRHGIVDNALYVPVYDSLESFSCGHWGALEMMARAEGRRVLDPPTLGEVLRSAGKRMACAGSGSQGTIHLADPTTTGPVVNWSTAWPTVTREEITRCCGPFLGPESTPSERYRFILRTALDYLVPEHNPDVLTIWLAEPDTTQHKRGLGSPESMAVLAQLDLQLDYFLHSLANRCGRDGLTCLFLSDHGYSTISAPKDPEQALAAAGFEEFLDAGDIIRTPNSLYIRRRARERLRDVVRFLEGEPWIGALLVRDDLLDVCPGAMPQSAAFGGHRRSAEIMFGYQWSDAENIHGVPGSVFSASKRNVATHGSASPYDIHNCLAAWGRGIKRGVISRVPCGYVDVAPTVLHLLGIDPPASMDGRALTELIEGGPDPDSMTVSHHTRETVHGTGAGARRQVALYSEVEGHRYLDRVTFG